MPTLTRTCSLAAAALLAGAAHADHTRNILITGYWPPTNEMLRPWSQNTEQNPGGWIGANWEGRGYDIYAYFPEFPGGTGMNPKGNGDLEVDYQDTAADWAQIVAAIRPVAIITFSRANTTRGWEMEPACQRFRLSGEPLVPGRTVPIYTIDYVPQTRPVDVPIAAETPGHIRNSSLPMQAIVDAVRAGIPSPTDIDPFVQNYDPMNPNGFDFAGGFLSGYIGYLGIWYSEDHAAADDPSRCVAAGHVHVGQGTNVLIARQATEISLRQLIAHVNSILPLCPADFNGDGSLDPDDLGDFINCYFSLPPCDGADFNADGSVDPDDLGDFINNYFAGC
ncbi:MAG: hypothetical protein AB7K52_11730 [Phycisphaerales bacterium]